jgi:arylformamidase
VELSHPIDAGMTTNPGMPGPVVSDYLRRGEGGYAPGTSFAIARIDLVVNTGTYLDTPVHRFADGHDLSAVPLDRVANLPGVVADKPVGRAIDAAALERALGGRMLGGAAVLLRTGWDRHWRSAQYGTGAPFLTEDGAAWLAEREPALVGIDSVNIDDTGDGARPAHTVLLRAGVLIVEHLTGLGALPTAGFRFFAAPPLFAGVGTFPVRAFAIVGA